MESLSGIKEITRNEFLKGITNKVKNEHKDIRQKSKPATFGLIYGCYPTKLATQLKCTLEEATKIWNIYNKELYPGITEFRDSTLSTAKKDGRVHLGLGCYINTSDPDKEIRTIFNARSQFWSILTLLTINKLHSIIDEDGLSDDIKIITTIYDSIYLHLTDDTEIIKYVNDTIIPLITTDFLENQQVKNEASGDIGYNWHHTVSISNNAPLDEIREAQTKAKELFNGLQTSI